MLDKIARITKLMVELNFSRFDFCLLTEIVYAKSKNGQGYSNSGSKTIGFKYTLWCNTFEVDIELLEYLLSEAGKINLIFKLIFEGLEREGDKPRIVFHFAEKKEGKKLSEPI
ncbi:MAG: hypothetical protein LBC68_13670 [Prevotellaceae bacterium]|jgi:hypothetical protein|nr:hypothetical protein [Prevotellaceae bacterium]